MAQTKTAKKSASKTSAKKTAAPKKKATRAAAKPAKKAPKKAAKAKATAKAKPSDAEVKLDRRRAAERRDEEAASPAAEEPKLERREKVNRRRQIDPTTCERDYSDAEVEFMNALDVYKRTSGRMFPTCSEVLEVIRGIGYVQLSAAELATIRLGRGETDSEPGLEESAQAEAEQALAESDEVRID